MTQNSITALSAALLLATAGAAQPFQAAFRDLPLQNRTSQGSTVLQARVYYPGYAPVQNAPMIPRQGGYPVYVFLHGMGSIGSMYTEHGRMFAERGYVCVLSDTAQSDGALQYLDGIAIYPSLTAENEDPQSFFYGALDMSHAAIGGYSMGGMSSMRVLSANCGYIAGFAHAPAGGTFWGRVEGIHCRQPFAIVQGTGDTVVSWQGGGYDWWSQTGFTGEKVFYLLDGACNHMNVCSVPSQAQIDKDIFMRAMSVCFGFLDAHVKGITAGLEEVLGGRARVEPHLTGLYFEVQQPALWTIRTGNVISLREVSEPGGMMLLASLGMSSNPTQFGILELAPETLTVPMSCSIDQGRFLTRDWFVPSALAGLLVHVQSLGVDNDQRPRLSNRASLQF